MNFETFLENRIQESKQQLYKDSGAYALAVNTQKECMDTIEPIVWQDNDTLISGGDCWCFQEYFANAQHAQRIVETHLYRQGVKDCVQLFKNLGILA